MDTKELLEMLKNLNNNFDNTANHYEEINEYKFNNIIEHGKYEKINNNKNKLNKLNELFNYLSKDAIKDSELNEINEFLRHYSVRKNYDFDLISKLFSYVSDIIDDLLWVDQEIEPYLKDLTCYSNLELKNRYTNDMYYKITVNYVYSAVYVKLESYGTYNCSVRNGTINMNNYYSNNLVMYGFYPFILTNLFDSIFDSFAKLHCIFIRYIEYTKKRLFNNLDDCYKFFLQDNGYLNFLEAAQYIKETLDTSNNYSFKKALDYEEIGYMLAKIANLDILKNIPIFGSSWNIKKTVEREFIMCVQDALKTKLFNKLNNLDTISNVAKKTNKVEGTIKHACQKQRLINVKKIGNTWLVDPDEVSKKIYNHYSTDKKLERLMLSCKKTKI